MNVPRLSLLLCLLISSYVFADVPASVNYQGYLTTVMGGPIDDVLPVRVSYWNDPTDESQDSFLYAETHSDVAIERGLFNIELGTGAPVEPGAEFDVGIFGDAVWLQITLDGEDLTPRRKFSSTAYSLRADIAESVATNAIGSNQIIDGSLTTNDIADDSLTGSDIADGTLTYFDTAPSSRQEIRQNALTATIQQASPRLFSEIELSPGVAGIGTVHANATATLSAGQGIVCWITREDIPNTSNEVLAKAPDCCGMTVPLTLTGRVFVNSFETVVVQHFCQITEGPLFLPVTNARMTVHFVPGARQ